MAERQYPWKITLDGKLMEIGRVVATSASNAVARVMSGKVEIGFTPDAGKWYQVQSEDALASSEGNDFYLVAGNIGQEGPSDKCTDEKGHHVDQQPATAVRRPTIGERVFNTRGDLVEVTYSDGRKEAYTVRGIQEAADSPCSRDPYGSHSFNGDVFVGGAKHGLCDCGAITPDPVRPNVPSPPPLAHGTSAAVNEALKRLGITFEQFQVAVRQLKELRWENLICSSFDQKAKIYHFTFQNRTYRQHVAVSEMEMQNV